MKRSGLSSNKPLKRTGYLRRTGRLPATSKKSRAKVSELDAITPALLERSKGVCEICVDAPATHRHHRLRRSQGGKNTLANLLHLCDKCHSYVHLQPTESYRQGWLLSVSEGIRMALGEQED